MARIKKWFSSIALADIASSLTALLFIVLVLSVSSGAISNADHNHPRTPSQTSSAVSETNDQTAKKSQQLNLPSTIKIPKPTPTIFPASVLNLANWKLTLPVETAHSGSPDEIKQPELAAFTLNPHFVLNSGKNGVVFRADVNGATTSGSSYPRSELREMTNSGKQNASWSNTSGTHTMTIRQAITHTPSAKPDVVAGQVHDASDDVVMVRLEGKRLFVESDGQAIGELDSNYSLGTVFTVQIAAADGHIKVHYNGEQKVDFARAGSGFYFKAGCYTQSNTSKGDSPEAYGEVVIYSLQVSHS